MKKLVLIKGAGDLASAIAVRLIRSGYKVIMTDISKPTTVRRTVAFSRAVYEEKALVEDIEGILVTSYDEAIEVAEKNKIAVIVDENADISKNKKFEIIVDAIIAKKNINTSIKDANLVIGVGPGFTPSIDCHCCVETKRGHYLGRVYYDRSAEPNTGIPGNIVGYTSERIIRASSDGIFIPKSKIGDIVKKGDILAEVKKDNRCYEIRAYIDGVVRGMLQEGISVNKNMKCGDVDPRGEVDYCNFVSDKGLAIAGGVLEAISKHVMEGI